MLSMTRFSAVGSDMIFNHTIRSRGRIRISAIPASGLCQVEFSVVCALNLFSAGYLRCVKRQAHDQCTHDA